MTRMAIAAAASSVLCAIQHTSRQRTLGHKRATITVTKELHLKPAGVRIGIERLGWHALRHSYRGLLNETGANTGMQMGLMRHASVPMAMNYGRAAIKAKQEANTKVVQMVLPRKVLCA